MSEKKNKKIFSIFFILAIFALTFSPTFAKKASAQWVVFDPANFANTLATQIKDYGLDSVAWIVVNKVIERMAASTVNWINTGFQGSPAFITDPEAYYSNIGNQLASQYINTNPELKKLCGPIQVKVRVALARNFFYGQNNYQCTLDDIYGNAQDFMDDFGKGGWDKWIELTQKDQNNPIGAFMQAQNELHLQIATRQSFTDKQLQWNNGFLSFRGPCTKITPDETMLQDQVDAIQDPAEKQKFMDDLPCRDEGPVQTPGSVIENTLNKTLHLGSDKLAVADEINEIVSALLNQLVSKAIGAAGNGLRSLSKPDSSNNGQTFTNSLGDRNSSNVGLFGDTPNLDAVNTPIDPSSAGINPNTLVMPTTGVPNQPPPFTNPNCLDEATSCN